MGLLGGSAEDPSEDAENHERLSLCPFFFEVRRTFAVLVSCAEGSETFTTFDWIRSSGSLKRLRTLLLVEELLDRDGFRTEGCSEGGLSIGLLSNVPSEMDLGGSS